MRLEDLEIYKISREISKLLSRAFLYLFIFLLPFQTRLILKSGNLNGGYWEYGTISLYLTDILFIGLVLSILVSERSRRPTLENPSASSGDPSTSSGDNSQGSPSTRFARSGTNILRILLVAFLFWSGLSIFWSRDKGLAFYSWLKLLEGIGLFWVVKNIGRDKTTLELRKVIARVKPEAIPGIDRKSSGIASVVSLPRNDDEERKEVILKPEGLKDPAKRKTGPKNINFTLRWIPRSFHSLGMTFWGYFVIQENSQTKLLLVLVISTLLQSFLAIGQFFTQTSLANKWLGMAYHSPSILGQAVVETLDGRWLRAYGSLPHPNILAGFLVLVIVSVIARERSNRSNPKGYMNKQKSLGLLRCSLRSLLAMTSWCMEFPRLFRAGYDRLIVLPFLIIVFTALFFTFSRGAWITLLLIGVLTLVSQLRTLKGAATSECVAIPVVAAGFSPSGRSPKGGSLRILLKSGLRLLRRNFRTFVGTEGLVRELLVSRRIAAFLLILYIFFLGFIFKDLVFTRFQTETRLEKIAIMERGKGLADAWNIIQKNPFTGVGAGNYTLALAQENNYSSPAWSYQPVHNIFLLIWSELGIMGLILFISILVYIFIRVYRYQNKGGCLIFALLLLSLFDHYFWSLHFGVLLFWLMLGIAQIKVQNSIPD